MEKRDAEFAELRRNAHEILSGRIKTPATQGHELTLRVIFEPAFENDVSLMIWQNSITTEYFARKVVWGKAFDANRFHNPLDGLKYGWHTAPTIRGRTALVDTHDVELLIQEGGVIPSDIEAHPGIQLDGVRWLLYFPGHFGDRVLMWNNSSQDQHGLFDWTSQTFKFLDNLFSE